MYKITLKDATFRAGMHAPLKAANLREESSDRKIIHAVALTPFAARDGFVFGLTSVPHKMRDGMRSIETIIREVERFAGSLNPDANAQHGFERFLAELNASIAERVRAGEWSFPVDQLNALVGIACDGQMFLSGTGDLTALFLHKTPEGRYQVFNLFRGIQTEQSLPNWEKTFAVVLDGTLAPGDTFCASNRDLARFIPADDLNTTLSSLPPAGATAKIRQYFPAKADLSLVILQSPNPTPSHAAPPLASVSLDRLVRTTEQTDAILEDQHPSPAAGFRGALRLLRAPGWRPLLAMRSLIRLGSSCVSIAARMARDAVLFAGRSIASLGHPDARSRVIAAARTGTSRGVRAATSRFRALPKTTRALAAAGAGTLLVLVVAVSVLERTQARSAELAAYRAKVAAVEETIERANGAVIYKDESQARALYAEALALAKALPVETEERARTASRLAAQIDGAFNDLRHIVTIPEPTLLAELSGSPGISGRALVSSEGGTYVLASDERTYRLDTQARSLLPLDAADGEIGKPSEAASENGTVLFLDDRPGISRLDLANKQLQVTNVLPTDGARWTDLALYGGKLYVLEPSSGQIIKYNRAGNGYDGGTRWIRARTADLSNAVSLAIDATVFVLKQNGQIIRYVGGSEVGWRQGPADPPVAAASDIWTSTESEYVYVLDPGTQRLIVYDKDDGDLVVQYRSDAFLGLTDLLVDEANKTITLLAGTRVFAISASHLK